MICPSCQIDNPPDSRYCRRCGSSIGELSGTLTFPESEEERIKKERRFSPGEKFGERYTIIEEVGRGGMGTAYKAEDKELGTVVVLKMIRPELATRPDIVEQFRKETLIGRTVTHENVVRIHDLGEVNKVKYISMDYIRGENLSELIHTSGKLTLETCLSITRQIGQALMAAHKKGFIHQDLKPSNVMIDNSGKVFVTDFGLARSVWGVEERPQKRLIGTPRYFSPEQARGEALDPRSDIYSLGIIMYEMVTGAPPFETETVEGYIHKHVSQKPIPPSRINRALPSSCEKIILKCLEKRREDRYRSVEELLSDLEAQRKRGPALAPDAKGRKWLYAFAAAALIVVSALAYLLLRPSHPLPSQPPVNSVAILYAVNNSGDKDLDKWLRWAITDLLTTHLNQSRILRVFPGDRLMQILENMKQLDEERHLSKTMDEIADLENIKYFVLPSFTKAGDSLRIDIKVQQARAKEILGTAFVQGKGTEDLWSMVDDLSLKVKTALNLSPSDIAADRGQSLEQITTGSLEALRYYVEGERLLTLRNFRASAQSFLKAVEADPNYAMAYQALAQVYDNLGDHYQHITYLKKALALVNRVSERDRLLIQGYASDVLDESPQQAIESFRKYTELYPQDEIGHVYLAYVYRDLEEWDQAIEQYEEILKINGRSLYAHDNLTFIYMSQGRYDKALNILQAARQIFPHESSLNLKPIILISLIQGHYAEADAALKNALSLIPDDSGLSEIQGNIFLLRDDFKSAETVFRRLQQSEEADPASPGFNGRFGLASLHLLQAKYGQTQEETLTGIQMSQKSNRLYDELDFRLLCAYSDLRLGRFPQVIDALGPVMEICRNIRARNAPKYAQVMSGIAYLGLGQIEKAREVGQQLRQSIEVWGFPRHMRYYEHLLGRIASAEKRPAEAVRHLEQAVSLLPAQREASNDHAFYYEGLAAAYYESGDFPKAKETYERIVSLTTGRLQWGDIYARAFYWLGKIDQKMGKIQEASRHYDKFLKLWENADPGRPEIEDARAQLAMLRGSL